jgi:hypothetical protein
VDPKARMFFVIIFSAAAITALAMFTEGYLPCVWEIPQWGATVSIPLPFIMAQIRIRNDRPALFIPTYPPPSGFGVDAGHVRPVPNVVPYYLCPGIQVMTAFQPGSPLTVKVTVGNWQGGNSASLAMAAVWWSPLLSGSTIPDPKKFIGFASVPLPPHGTQGRTHAITATIPTDAPPHICLLAKVWHALDMPPTTQIAGKTVEVADPINDRHWAQHNLVAVQAAGPQTIQFLATNLMPRRARFDLIVQPLGREKWSALTEGEYATPVQTRARFRLSGPENYAETTGDNTLRHEVILEAGGHGNMTLSVDLPKPLEPRTFAAFEVLQFDESHKPVGGFGIVLRADRTP